MRVSAIEIGTNSTKFIIAELNDRGSIEVIKRTSIVNRLSTGMYLDNNLSPLAIERSIEIIDNLVNESNKHKAKLISIFSTSVLRDAGNKQVLLDRVKESFGVEINIISGEKEAYYAYTACKEVVENKNNRFAVIDIGGGSTEIIVGNVYSIEQKVSLDIGAVRLTELFVKHDPIEKNELEQITFYINSKITELGSLDLRGLQFIGTGGTIKSLGTLSVKENYSNESKVNGWNLSIDDIERLLGVLSKLNTEGKISLVGLNPKRADVITTGVLILFTVMRRFNIEQVKISTQGVLEGFVTEYIKMVGISDSLD